VEVSKDQQRQMFNLLSSALSRLVCPARTSRAFFAQRGSLQNADGNPRPVAEPERWSARLPASAAMLLEIRMLARTDVARRTLMELLVLLGYFSLPEGGPLA
jgi:hypothetical protein